MKNSTYDAQKLYIFNIDNQICCCLE